MELTPTGLQQEISGAAPAPQSFAVSALRARQEMDELAALAPRLQGQPPEQPGTTPGAPGEAPSGTGAPPDATGGAAPEAMPPEATGAPPGAPPEMAAPGNMPPAGPPPGQPDPALRARMLEMQNPLAALTARYLGGQNAQQ